MLLIDHLALVQAYMRQRYNAAHAPPPQLAVGDWVWLELHDGYSLPPSLLTPDRCLGVQRVGPYPIKRVISDLAYEFTSPSGNRLHPVISIQHLEPYIPSDKPVTTAIITAILRERETLCRGLQYLVRFEHAGRDNNSTAGESLHFPSNPPVPTSNWIAFSSRPSRVGLDDVFSHLLVTDL
ncbi:hypothetical protein NDA13_000184 [Ustilago tritici]|nr:hypothetical protein NDA13_000184 [Ustilago tritici]